MKHWIKEIIVIFSISLISYSCAKQKGVSDIEVHKNSLPEKEYLGYVDTRIGTAPSIADVTVTETEEPLGPEPNTSWGI